MGRIAIFFTLLSTFLAGSVSLGAGEVVLSLTANQVAADSEFVLKLSASGSVNPTLLEAPDFMKVLSVSRGSFSQSINGQTTQESSSNYLVSIEQPGEYSIGPLKAQLGDEEFYTNVVKVKVMAPEKITVPITNTQKGVVENAEIGELIFGVGLFPGERTNFYVGEDIPLELKLYVADKSNFNLVYPVIDAGKALFADYTEAGGENQNFAPLFTTRGEAGERKYEIYHFNTSFRALAPGKLQINAVENAKMLIREGRRSYSFFDSGVRTEVYKIKFKIPEITIMPLPAAVEKSNFTGLIGDWKITAALGESSVRQGEAVNLHVELNGIGAVDNLSAPELKIADFRIFPPEIVKRPGRLPGDVGKISINYVLIPLRQGENQPVAFNLSTFNPASGEYAVNSFDLMLNVAPGAVAAVEETNKHMLSENISNAETAEKPIVLSGWKNEEGSWITPPFGVPGWKFWLWLIPAPLLWMVLEFRRRKIINRQGDTAYRRKIAARKHVSKVVKTLADCPPEELPGLVNSQLLPCLADYWNLPPGSTAGELAESSKAKEIRETLQKIGEINYAPIAPDEATLEVWRNNLLNFLKRLGMIFILPLLMVGFELSGGDISGSDYWSAAHNAALEGDYTLAAEQLSALEQLKTPAMSAECAYNLGYAFQMLGKKELALYYFEQAYLLKPWDDEIQFNLNISRHNFLQKSVNSAANPGELLVFLVQHLRPEQYAMAMVIVWSMLFIWLIFRRRQRGVVNWSVICIGVLLLIGFAGAMIYEVNGPYNSRRALVVVPRAEFYRLPNELGSFSDGSLTGGSSVEVVERHGNFVRVKDGLRDGWVKSDTVKLLLPEVQN